LGAGLPVAGFGVVTGLVGLVLGGAGLPGGMLGF